MNLQPILRGQHISLEPLKNEDLEALYEAGSDPEIWAQHPEPIRYQRPRFEDYFRKAIESKGAFKVIDNQSGNVIGSTRYYELNQKDNSVMIGYTFLTRSYWGGKFNQEMKKLLLDYAFQFLDKVYFQIGEKNIRSQKALEKIGGKLVKKMILEEQPYRQYVIDRNDWKQHPLSKADDKVRGEIDDIRITLLELHKMLIDRGRTDYEQKNGVLKNPSDWIKLLIGDPFFAWLHPLTKLITTMDELLEIGLPISELDAKAVRAEVENMIGDYPTTPKDFRNRYLDIIQREPNAVMKLSSLKQLLQNLPKPDDDKMEELLNVRQQWSAALKLKYFKSNKKQ